jgi:hypothetical protein
VTDAAISRFGVMLVPDPRQALAEMCRVLKPSRRAAVVVWGSADRNPFQSLPFAILRRLGVVPQAPAGPSGPFGLGDPGILASTIESAGFRELAVEAAPIRWRFASVADALAYYRLAAAPLPPEVAARLGEEGGGRLTAELEQVLRQFERSGGVEVPGEALIGSGTK